MVLRNAHPTRSVGSGPPSSQPPQPLSRRQAEALAAELVTYHAQFHDLFARREQREWSAFYLRGQLAPLPRKTIEPMVLAFAGAAPAAVRAVQQFISEGAWDDAAILARLETLVAADLGTPEGLLIVDGSGFPKQGTHSVGVARQYCGHLGKVANCQEGVFLAYASRHGCTFVDRRLYLPKAWFDAAHADKRRRYGVPETLRFQTEPALGLAMVRGVVERGVLPVRWILGDEPYGASPTFVDGVAALATARGPWYYVEVPLTTRAWVGAIAVEPPGQGPQGRPRTHARARAGTPKPRALKAIAARLPARAWRRYDIKLGAKGAITADFAFVRVTRARRGGRPGAEVWAVLRRSLGPAPELKVFLTNAPASWPKRALVRVSGQRWPIEVAFEEAKGEVGLDHYEVRTWRGWHHHMTQTFLAHHFLLRWRRRGKKSGAHASPSAPAAHGDAPRARPLTAAARAGHRAVLPSAELCRAPQSRAAVRRAA